MPPFYKIPRVVPLFVGQKDGTIIEYSVLFSGMLQKCQVARGPNTISSDDQTATFMVVQLPGSDKYAIVLKYDRPGGGGSVYRQSLLTHQVKFINYEPALTVRWKAASPTSSWHLIQFTNCTDYADAVQWLTQCKAAVEHAHDVVVEHLAALERTLSTLSNEFQDAPLGSTFQRAQSKPLRIAFLDWCLITVLGFFWGVVEYIVTMYDSFVRRA